MFKIINLDKFFISLKTMKKSNRPNEVIYRNTILKVNYKEEGKFLKVKGERIKFLIDFNKNKKGSVCTSFETQVELIEEGK